MANVMRSPMMRKSGQSPVQAQQMNFQTSAPTLEDLGAQLQGMMAKQNQNQNQQFNQQVMQDAVGAMAPGAKAQSPIVGPTQMSDSQRMAAILSQMR